MLLVDCWKQHAIFIYLYTGATCIRIYENYIVEKESYKYKKGWNLGFFQSLIVKHSKHKVIPLNEWK